MKLKDIKLKKLIKILVITTAVSIILLGLVVWIFNIPAYIRGEKGSYSMNSENSVLVNVNKKYEMDNINGSIGDGNGLVRISTSSGDITINRK